MLLLHLAYLFHVAYTPNINISTPFLRLCITRLRATHSPHRTLEPIHPSPLRAITTPHSATAPRQASTRCSLSLVRRSQERRERGIQQPLLRKRNAMTKMGMLYEKSKILVALAPLTQIPPPPPNPPHHPRPNRNRIRKI